MSDAREAKVVSTGVAGANIRHYPVGTLEELKELCRGDEERFEAAKLRFATCSKPGPDNRGCAFYKKCEFKKVRGVSGPRRYGILQAILNGLAAIRVMPCFVYMAVVHPIRKLSKSQAVRVIAREGDLVKVRETRRVNPKDPKDMRHQLQLVEKEITPFQRPNVTMAELAFTMETLADAELARLRERDESIMRGASFVGDTIDGLVDELGTTAPEKDDAPPDLS